MGFYKDYLTPFFSMSSISDVAVQTMKQCHFVICNKCYWCATNLAGSGIESCNVCGSRDSIEPIELQPKEKYSFALDSKRGVILDFV